MFLNKKTYDFVIVGLGNYGDKYDFTRHNAGFMAIEYISQTHGIKVNKLKHRALVGDGVIAGKRVLLVMPQTYMNLSGESVREIVNYYKITMDNVIIIYDDISLAVGKLRIRNKGSAGGHNGIKSIIANMNTDSFLRVKIGVGEKPCAEYDLADWVLSKFSKEEQKMLFEQLKKVNDAVEDIMTKPLDRVMNMYN